ECEAIRIVPLFQTHGGGAGRLPRPGAAAFLRAVYSAADPRLRPEEFPPDGTAPRRSRYRNDHCIARFESMHNFSDGAYRTCRTYVIYRPYKPHEAYKSHSCFPFLRRGAPKTAASLFASPTPSINPPTRRSNPAIRSLPTPRLKRPTRRSSSATRS